jgi:hypothetical protein
MCLYPINTPRRNLSPPGPARGGVRALPPPATGRHTTPPGAVPLPRRDERPRTHVLSAESATLPNPPRIRDRALWKAAQQLMAGHLCVSPDETRCANPRCDPDAAYPCTPSRLRAIGAYRNQAEEFAPASRHGHTVEETFMRARGRS